MSNRRAKLTAGATVLGLGALGAAAMATNQGPPAGQGLSAAGKPGAVVTSASGAAATQPAVTTAPANSRAPIVARASGGGAAIEVDE